jgi:hypothetical protein
MRSRPGYDPKTRIFIYATAVFSIITITLHDPNITMVYGLSMYQAQDKQK